MAAAIPTIPRVVASGGVSREAGSRESHGTQARRGFARRTASRSYGCGMRREAQDDVGIVGWLTTLYVTPLVRLVICPVSAW